jgi:hypothetical protein
MSQMKKVMFITALALGFVSNAQVSEVEYIYNKRFNALPKGDKVFLQNVLRKAVEHLVA